ncbi:MAG TPA: citrate/2-methylcitrate synthase [Hyphomicrobiaceae bacterium]
MLISAQEAARRLGVKPATLYAYVSRELLRSAPGADSRSRRYYAEDVERLRRSRHRGPRTGKPPKPFDSLMPVLDTTISLIENGRLYYRGSDAVRLAETADLEAVAHILWEQADPDDFRVGQTHTQLRRLLAGRHLPPVAMDRARTILSELTMHDVAALDTSPLAVRRTGARLVSVLTASVTGTMPSGLAVHEELRRAWKLDASASDLVRRCLVLIADHELNASTYVGRCIASTGATPYAVVLGALGALSGPKHGGETGRVEAFLGDVLRSGDVQRAVAERLQRGERIPGFGQPLYPNGDPRGRDIIDAIKRSRYARTSVRLIDIGARVCELIGRHPNVDFALGLVSIALKLPAGSGLGMFLIGRCVGWIAHAIEQYATEALIRPRARYVGILPLTVQ